MKLSVTNFNMHYLKLLFLLILLRAAAAITPLYTSCSGSNSYSSTDAFGNNLIQLMSVLTESSPSIGFGLGSFGQGANRVNGLALCRGGITSSKCKLCIRNAHARISHACPFKKQAFIIFDECQLRYADTDFFGEIDEGHKLCLCNTHNVSLEVMTTMNRLKMKAYISPLLFAMDVMEIRGGKMYGMAQCGRDISGGDCKRCLESAVDELNGCCEGRAGGRVVGGSCNVRYELYPFFDPDDAPYNIIRRNYDNRL